MGAAVQLRRRLARRVLRRLRCGTRSGPHGPLPATVGGGRLILQQISLDLEKASESWYLDIPVIAQLAEQPLALDAPVTVIVGENGSGKSTLLEAVAASWAARLRGAVKHWTP